MKVAKSCARVNSDLGARSLSPRANIGPLMTIKLQIARVYGRALADMKIHNNFPVALSARFAARIIRDKQAKLVRVDSSPSAQPSVRPTST